MVIENAEDTAGTKRSAAVLTGGRTETCVLDREAFFKRARAARLRTNPNGPMFSAMYSSLLDGVITDPDLMVVPLDDHAIVRGHAVFDTATLANGRVFRLGIHLDRFFSSAKSARLPLPFGSTEEECRKRMTDIVCATSVASKLRDGSIRFWWTAGPGNLGFTTEGCEPAFYCAVYSNTYSAMHPIDEVTVRSGCVPMKPPMLAQMKTNNYLLNVLTAMAAQDKGGHYGLMVRDDDTLAEGCVANVIVVTKEQVLLTPPFDGILRGTTARKVMELAKKHLVGGEGALLKEIRQETVHLAQARAAAEIIMCGGDLHISPVIKLDGEQVGQGKAGGFPVATALFSLLVEESRTTTDEHIELQY